MDLLLPTMAAHLARWEARPFHDTVALGPAPGDKRDVYTRRIGHEPQGPPAADGPYRRAADAILGYRIFPDSVIAGVLRRAPVHVGDTVGIRYRGLGLVHLFFAARVVAVFDGPDAGVGGWRAGFTYHTLRGHPELGEETFAVTRTATGEVEVSLTAWSRPGTWLARLLPFVVRFLQVRGSRAALTNLAAVAAGP
jgi:uncharacterized protein (UPF0548 family)